MPTSRIPGFYRLKPDERRGAIEAVAELETDEVQALQADALSLESANMMIENVIGTFGLPLAVGVNFLVNAKDVVVPMVVEEPSVVAAVSNMAKLVRAAGGFVADADRGVMIGQVLIVGVADVPGTMERIAGDRERLLALADSVHPRLRERGGGIVGMDVRRVEYDEPGQPAETFVVFEIHLDCLDAMGANMVNTVCERLAPEIETLARAPVAMRILSNLASRRLARARCTIPTELLAMEGGSGDSVGEAIARATRFAWADPWRAATHNKGVMNGIDAVAIATGNDWRAIEAGAHAWASRDGRYRSLTRWWLDGRGHLEGSIELPIQVGVVGGQVRSHPTVVSNLKILGNPTARELSGLMAAVGLAQNLGALRALSTEGIQRGHMRMHARTIAAQAGARSDEVDAVASQLAREQEFSVEHARAVLHRLRHADRG
jgi:hydroxymethylglutaryl-CoA reductase